MRHEHRKILVMGARGAGKTTLARWLAGMFAAVHWNEADVHESVECELGSSREDQTERARRLGWLCDQVVEAGNVCVADSRCPIQEARDAFGPCFLVWVDRGISDDGFEPPETYDFRIDDPAVSSEDAARDVFKALDPLIEWDSSVLDKSTTYIDSITLKDEGSC